MQMKASLAAIPGRVVNLPAVPAVSRTSEAAERIVDPGVTLVERKPEDLDEIASRLIEAFGTGRTPERRDLNQAAWCIWDGKRPLAGTPDVLGRLLDHVRRGGKQSAFRRLASVYLSKFEPLGTSKRAGVLRQVAKTLSAVAPDFTGTYSDAGRALHLYDPDRGPNIIAERALAARTSPSKVLEDAGIRNMAAEGGLAEAAFLAGLNQLRHDANLTHPDRLARIAEWGLRRDGKVAFEQHRGPFVDALVLPHGTATPPREIMDAYLKFLIAHFGDPRIRQGNWAQMQSAPTVRRWLTAVSLRQFLDVVDREAKVHQWPYRRAFWEAVHRRELISEAWVVFDEAGDRAARKLFKIDAPYARFTSGGRKQVEKGHAVLLLRVGGGVIAEWSQNGRCDVWHSVSDPTAPKLHQPEYDTDEVRVLGGSSREFRRAEISHNGSAGYHWQAKVANEIYALTNVRVMESEYRLT
ncbi:hypothetical protein LPLAFNJD_LOCUS1944 [Methylorubrum aminovorans]